jgi:hypothetical protein
MNEVRYDWLDASRRSFLEDCVVRASVCLIGPLLWDVAVAVECSAPRFTRKPTARKVEDKVRIAFAVRARTDVEVSILDAEGKVVRHFAAGVLGSNVPAPLQKGALTQELLWDGKDDYGKPAEGGPFEVRVAAGMTPKFEESIGFNPAYMFMVRSPATGPDGTVYTCTTTSSAVEAARATGPSWLSTATPSTFAPSPPTKPTSPKRGLRASSVWRSPRV